MESKPKSMFEQYQDMVKLGSVPQEQLFVPIMRWSSNSEKTIHPLNDVNRYFFTVDKEMLMRMIVLNRPRNPFQKYPKKQKSDDDIYTTLKPYIKRYYRWLENDYNACKECVKITQEFVEELHRKFVLDDDTRKLWKIRK